MLIKINEVNKLENNDNKFIISNNKSNKLIKLKDDINEYNPLTLNNKTETKNKKNDNKLLYWEYGNSGFKLKNFTKTMNKNLAIMYYIDKVFQDFLLTSDNSYNKLFTSEDLLTYNFNKNIITSNNKNVSVKINHDKINGEYEIIAAGVSTITNILIDENDLKKKKVPDLDSILSHINNIKQILKMLNILNLFNKFTITNNNSDSTFDLQNIIKNTQEIILENKNNLLKSNKHTAFYIKIYDTSGKAFIIDNNKEIIYYISESEENNKIYIRYYIFKINNNGKIISK
jgi:hypothetical protein